MGAYKYWQHFLALESDFASTARYVEFSDQNFSTFSVEYAKLILSIGSEIDVLCKIICENISNSEPRNNINDYRNIITQHTTIGSENILIRRYDLSFTPWDTWLKDENPSWWRSYNNIKHERNTHYENANLRNCAEAISALFVVVLYCHKAEQSDSSLEPLPILLGREKEPGLWELGEGYDVPDFD